MDAVVFGSPTCMGGVSEPFRAFMETSFERVLTKGVGWANKLAAGFTNAASLSGGKLTALQHLSAFAAQHGMHWVNPGLPPELADSNPNNGDPNWGGFHLGAVALSRAGQGTDATPPPADLRTSEMLGARVANVAWQLLAGRLALQTLTLPLSAAPRIG
jgi:NAD(P)H dehydrogenase (quinone)